MYWQHEVAADWLKARKKVITATELMNLVPAYLKHKKAGEKAPVFCPTVVGLWAEKQSTVPPETRSPSSQAARGHHLEAYAIEDWNRQMQESYGLPVYHWDDCLVTNGDVGQSPDALDIPKEDQYGFSVPVTSLEYEPKMVLEVKSYEPKAHMQKLFVPPKELPEARQIAASFVTMPTLESGILLFYCPALPENRVQMFYREYTRGELADDISLLNEVLCFYVEQVEKLDGIPPQMLATKSENEIYDELFVPKLEVMRFR